MKNDPNIIYMLSILCAVMFFAGKACGREEFAGRIDALQEQAAKIDERVRAIEYPEGEKKYFWPKEKKRRLDR